MTPVSKVGLNALSQIKEGLSSGNWGLPDIDDWLIRASIGMPTMANEIKEKMMSIEDIRDLKNGLIPFESLKLYVKVWCEVGKPNYNYLPEVNNLSSGTK